MNQTSHHTAEDSARDSAIFPLNFKSLSRSSGMITTNDHQPDKNANQFLLQKLYDERCYLWAIRNHCMAGTSSEQLQQHLDDEKSSWYIRVKTNVNEISIKTMLSPAGEWDGRKIMDKFENTHSYIIDSIYDLFICARK